MIYFSGCFLLQPHHEQHNYGKENHSWGEETRTSVLGTPFSQRKRWVDPGARVGRGPPPGLRRCVPLGRCIQGSRAERLKERGNGAPAIADVPQRWKQHWRWHKVSGICTAPCWRVTKPRREEKLQGQERRRRRKCKLQTSACLAQRRMNINSLLLCTATDRPVLTNFIPCLILNHRHAIFTELFFPLFNRL